MIYSRQWNPSPITAEENTYLPACSVKARQRQTEGGVRSQAHWVSSSLYLGTFLMKYLSPAVRPVVTVQLFLPHLMFSCCSIQPLSLLAWLPAMPESFQQSPLSASWSYMNKTTSNFETMACFAMCLYVSIKTNPHCAAVWVLTGCKSMQI